MEQGLRTKTYTQEQVNEQRRIVNSLNGYVSPPISPPALAPCPEEKQASEANLSPAVQQIIAQLKAEREKIDKQKNALANKMTTIPDQVNCKDLVQQIKQLRNAWIAKGDEILYVTRHGELPNATTSATNIVIELPADKMELNRMLLNTRSNLSKYRKRLALAKEDSQKQLQEKNIKKAELLIQNIEFKINAL
jgi:hypothetical protein